MSESQGADVEQGPDALQGLDALQARIETLRRDGGARVDPARFQFLEALSRRIPGQPDAVRGLLQARLQAALRDCAASIDAAKVAGAAKVADATKVMTSAGAETGAGTGAGAAGAVLPVRRIALKPTRSPSPLVQLNQSLLAARAQARPEDAGDPDELSSARRFRRTWTSLRIQDQVDEAVARKPANAGPLNSHVLVLQSLDLMRALSPQYLERFLAHVETLQWLEQAGQKSAEPQGKPAKGERRKARKS